jgi:hypothetical protein
VARPAIPVRQNVSYARTVSRLDIPEEREEPAHTPVPPLAVVFQYIGPTALTAVGPVSGRRYHFAYRGAVLAIDPRDQASLAGIAKLQQVRSS